MYREEGRGKAGEIRVVWHAVSLKHATVTIASEETELTVESREEVLLEVMWVVACPFQAAYQPYREEGNCILVSLVTGVGSNCDASDSPGKRRRHAIGRESRHGRWHPPSLSTWLLISCRHQCFVLNQGDMQVGLGDHIVRVAWPVLAARC